MAQPTRHLNATTLLELLGDPAANADLVAHLEQSCAECELFLASQPGPGLLDGRVDALLLGLRPAAEAAIDDAGWARVSRALRTPRRRRLSISLAVAGLFLAALASSLLRPAQPQPPVGVDGLKGNPVEVAELMVVWRDERGDLTPVGPGTQVAPRGTLLFRVRSPVSGQGLLLVQRGLGAPVALRAVVVPAGTNDLREGAEAIGFSLEAEAGPVTLWLIVREGRTAPTPEVALEAVRSGAARGLAVGRFEVRVQP